MTRPPRYAYAFVVRYWHLAWGGLVLSLIWWLL